MKSMVFRRVPLLASLSIVIYQDKDGRKNWEGVTSNIIEFFDGLSSLEHLHLCFGVVLSLAADGVPRSLQTSLIYLKDLILSEIVLDELKELSVSLCFVRNSPNLKHIVIDLFIQPASDSKTVLEILKEEFHSDLMLNKLEEVKLQNVIGKIAELEFVKLLLAKSPSLEKMLVHPGKEVADNGYKILKELTKFRRASKEAEVIYVDATENQV